MKIILCFAVLSLAYAHSWVERLMGIAPNGSMTGAPGYPRGTVSRLSPQFNDLAMQHLLPPHPRSSIISSDKICKDTQSFNNYSTQFPMLEVPQGSFIALQYQENGHVTLPQNSPQKRSSGLVYIYGTMRPLNDDRILSIHHVWNTDATGGDKRGALLAVRSFDDGQCYQINNGDISKHRQKVYPKLAQDPQGADLWCQNDIRLPSDAFGIFTLYWVWDWPSVLPHSISEGAKEIYTTCIDIKITPMKGNTGMSFARQSDLNRAGIKSQLEY